MEILHECPFCENNNVELFYWDNALVWKLHCPICNITYTNTDKEKIVKFWNNRPKEKTLENNINTLKEELLIARASSGVSETNSYIDMRNERDALQGELNTSKDDIEKLTSFYATMKNKYDILQKSFDKNVEFVKKETDSFQTKLDNAKAIHLRRMEALEASNTLKINKAQAKIEALKEDIQTAMVSYTDMQNKYNVLQKSFDEQVKISKKENNIFQTTLDSERTKYQNHIDTIMQSNTDIIDKELRKIISYYNIKLDTIKLDENKIIDGTIERIKGEYAKRK